MENEQTVANTENRWGIIEDDSSAQVDEVNKESSSDNENGTNMKEDFIHQREGSSISMNSTSDDNKKLCANLTMDNYKEDSDLSDFGDDSTRCQLANNALRARLINTAINQGSGTDSKLRVSVFDHRNIPKKFISARGRQNHSDVNVEENGLESSRNGLTNGVSVQNSVSRGRGAPCAVLRANRRTSSSSSCGHNGENVSTMNKRNSEYRTRFDILLRKLIGDVDDMQVEPSPMTVSSGYESDYVQTRENDNQSVFNRNNNEDTQNKENVVQKETEPTIDYFSMSETYPEQPVNASLLSQSHAFSSLPTFPTQEEDKPRAIESKEAPPIKHSAKSDRDSGQFSYAQRHNYKLTKVTRNMYEIIHDLQNGEKAATVDTRKRSRKGRRSMQEGISGSDGNSSAKEIKPRGRIQSCDFTLDNSTPIASFQTNREANAAAISGAVVRCVRRPLGGDSAFRPAQRKLSYSESNNRLAPSCAKSDCDKVQNDLRNLLCSTSDVTLSSADNNEQTGDFNTLSSTNNSRDGLGNTINGHMDNGLNHTNVSINRGPDTVGMPRRSTLTEQFNKRAKPDDHVYETIPGDEKLYEEWKKLRATSKMPRIRRFTTVPDLPGTFVPKDPPALPERKYLASNPPQQKDNDNYIFMGDSNSNLFNRNTTERLETGYAVASDTMLDPRWFQCYPYPIPDDSVQTPTGRFEETSDGYCSIDNLSLLNGSSGVPLPDRSWHVPSASALSRVLQTHEDFQPQVRNKRTLNGFNSFSNHVDLQSRPFGFELADRRLPNRTESDSVVLSANFEKDTGKQVFQATYV